MQEACPARSPKNPARQGLHEEEPAKLIFPGGQLKHSDAAEAPITLENVPASHGVHEACPESIENDPAGQEEHTAILLAPTVALYFPAGHAEHSVVPGLLQLPIEQHTPAPALLFFPVGHSRQADKLFAPLNRLKVLALHNVQKGAPTSLKVPAGQIEQYIAPGALKFPESQI